MDFENIEKKTKINIDIIIDIIYLLVLNIVALLFGVIPLVRNIINLLGVPCI